MIKHIFGSDMPPELADLITVAMAVYTADRLCRRNPREVNRYDQLPPRKFDLCLVLHQPDFWKSTEVGSLLQDYLWFLTEDLWTLRFFALPEDSAAPPRQAYLFPTRPEPPVRVSLFSGGLDSFAGLCQDILNHPASTFVTVAGYTSSRLVPIQRSLLTSLKVKTGARVIPIQVPFRVERVDRAYEQEERSQRTRGFVYAILGSVVAILAGADSLLLYENGVGAINLPFTEGQLGVANTRATHPNSIAMVHRLLQVVTGRDIALQLPFLFTTKGQICRAVEDLGLPSLVRDTVSCDGFAQRTPGRHQCGRCTSCLLRRAALHAAGLQGQDDPSRYVTDIYSPNSPLSEAQAYPAKAMRDQVRRLEHALQGSSPWRALTREFPMLVEAAETAKRDGQSALPVESQLVALYEEYCREWRAFEALWRAPTLPCVA